MFCKDTWSSQVQLETNHTDVVLDEYQALHTHTGRCVPSLQQITWFANDTAVCVCVCVCVFSQHQHILRHLGIYLQEAGKTKRTWRTERRRRRRGADASKIIYIRNEAGRKSGARWDEKMCLNDEGWGAGGREAGWRKSGRMRRDGKQMGRKTVEREEKGRKR